MMFNLLTHVYVTRPHWVNSLDIDFIPGEIYDQSYTRSRGISVKNMHLIGDIICTRYYKNSKLDKTNL